MTSSYITHLIPNSDSIWILFLKICFKQDKYLLVIVYKNIQAHIIKKNQIGVHSWTLQSLILSN